MITRRRCIRCEAEVMWCQNTAGEWIALDVEEVHAGPRYRVVPGDFEESALAAKENFGPGHRDHETTCKVRRIREARRPLFGGDEVPA